MPKYAEGERVTYKNGAVAEAQANGMMKIISGPTKGSKRRNISARSAKRAFNKYWNKRTAAVKGNKKRSRGVASARGRDIQYGSPKNLRKHSGYKQNPGRLDYAGVDYGSKRYTVSPRSLANLKNQRGGRRKNSPTKKMKAKKSPTKRGGGKKPVSLKTAVKLLREYYRTKYE